MINLQKRLHLSFVVALGLVLVTGITSIYYLHKFDAQVHATLIRDMDIIQSSASLEEPVRAEMARNRLNIDRMFVSAQQNQMLIFVIVVVGGAFLAFFMPRRAVWPFKRVLRAFGEVLECHLNVRLPVHGGDELAELSRTFNLMMSQLEELDEMKVKRIAFERRRFELLANALDMGVVLASVEGKIIFMNAPAFRAFNVTSEQVINKDMDEAPLPASILDLLREGLDERARLEHRLTELTFEMENGKEETRKLHVDVIPVLTHAGELVNALMFIEEWDVARGERIFQHEVHS